MKWTHPHTLTVMCLAVSSDNHEHQRFHWASYQFLVNQRLYRRIQTESNTPYQQLLDQFNHQKQTTRRKLWCIGQSPCQWQPDFNHHMYWADPDSLDVIQCMNPQEANTVLHLESVLGAFECVYLPGLTGLPHTPQTVHEASNTQQVTIAFPDQLHANELPALWKRLYHKQLLQLSHWQKRGLRCAWQIIQQTIYTHSLGYWCLLALTGAAGGTVMAHSVSYPLESSTTMAATAASVVLPKPPSRNDSLASLDELMSQMSVQTQKHNIQWHRVDLIEQANSITAVLNSKNSLNPDQQKWPTLCELKSDHVLICEAQANNSHVELAGTQREVKHDR